MSEVETLRTQQQAAVDRYHAIQREFAEGLAKTHFSEQLAAVDTANRVLSAAGFPADLRFWFRIEYPTNEGGERTPVLCCSLHGLSLPADAVLRGGLSDVERAACVANKAEAGTAWQEYVALGRQVMEAEVKRHKARKPLKFKQLLALASGGHDEQEQYYVDHGPRKHEQEDFIGTQVVQMNVSLLAGWLGDAGEDFENLPTSKRRKVWEASAFHFGINGYDDADSDHFWRQETQ